jgi:branched-chain amino acid transport system substrate-binding protein
MAIRHLVLTIFLSMFIIISTGCDESINEDKIEINFAITGEKVLYDYDESFMNGVRMAIADCNLQYADLGYQVSMEFYDDESIFEKGMAIANSIARDNSVSAVLGSQSFYITDAAAEIFENAGKILITPFSANDETLEVGYQYLFRNTFSAYDVGVALARYAAKKNYKNIAVCIKGTEYEAAVIRGFYRESRDLGPKIVDYLTKARTQEELREVFTRWDLLSVDCVLIIQFHEDDAFALLKAIRAK